MTTPAARPDDVPSAPGWAGLLARVRRFLAEQFAALPQGPVLLVLFVGLFLFLCALLLYATAGPAKSASDSDRDGPAEFDLRAGPTSSKLNSTSAETSISVHVPVSPPGPEPPAVLPQRIVQAAVIEVPETPPDLHRGGSPMMRTSTRFCVPAILAAALAASPTFGQIDGDPDKTDAILSQLKNVTKSLQDLKGLPASVSDLEKKLTDLEKKLTEQLANQDISTNLRIQDLRRDLGALKAQHDQLKQEMEAFRNRLPARQPTTSLYPQNGTVTGRLRLVNTWPEDVTIVVNNRPAYRLAPGQTTWVESVPAGLFTYEVLGIQPRTSRSLGTGETFTIHVFPR